MRRLLSLFAVSLLALGACTATAPTTPAAQTVQRVRLELELQPGSVEITRSERSSNPNYKVEISEKDKADATQRAARLEQLLSQGFTARFPRAAAAQGLQVVTSGDVEHVLRLRVVWREMKCGPFSCAAQLRVRGDVVDRTGRNVWHFIMMFGQERHEEPMNNSTVDRFARQVLEQMRKDGLLVAVQ
jgi:hypothetical protein